jgi:UDP-N-acetylmuramoylalanine--D-glutamate ligase
MESMAGKRVTVFGLGRFGGGIGVARWLAGQGARVVVTDQQPAEKLADSVAALRDAPVGVQSIGFHPFEFHPFEFHLGQQRAEDFAKVDLVVASPAIPPTNPMLAIARDAGTPVTTEIRLFVERCPGTILGVTGTKGKSTTSAMLGRMLATRFTTHVGGNIGGSLLDKLPAIGASDLVVLELSSYMLHHLGQCRWSPHIAVVTMIGVDHVEWHGSAEAYVEAKKNILRFQRPDEYAVINDEDPGAAAFASLAPGKVIRYRVGRPFSLLTPGRHNQLNAHGAFAAASIMGITWDQAQAALRDFPGLPHRLQLVHEAGGVQYFDDSIATIPEAAIAALDSFPPKKVIQIVGGYDNHAPLTALITALVERAKAILCIGQRGPEISRLAEEGTSLHAAATYNCGDLPTAVKVAKSIAVPGDIVLLSTGCKSYDQFVNFEQRGDCFVIEVKK